MASMEAIIDEQPQNVQESLCQIFSQSVIPFFLGGCGSISAGLLLTFANKNLMLLEEVPEFLVLMPPLQGLRGNLDMTFAARMSTLAHVGEFDKPGLAIKIRRNAAVAQGLSIFVCLVANIISMFIVSVTPSLPEVNNTNRTFTTVSPPPEKSRNFMFLTSSSIISMAVNCAVCTLLLFTIVYCTWKRHFNPDNIVAPLGASISDLLTIGSMLLACYSIRPYSEFNEMVPIVVIVIALFSVPIWLCLAWEDDTAVKIARQQCLTLIIASMISCGAGFLQSRGAVQFPNYPAYQTLISGLTGNRGAVLASRISSHLEVHKESEMEWNDRARPHRYYMSRSPEAKTAKLLLFTAVPFQLFFVGVSTLISCLMSDPVETDYRFFLVYPIVVFIQVWFVSEI
uniref:MgtE domain-containing protein n=1 Tax=Caenorhabditis japonica TaxID=281687 RepID=A0A8R1HLI4_CAEJA